MESVTELRQYVGVCKAQTKAARNQLRTLISLLAELEERLSVIEGRLDLALAIAQPKEAQRNGTGSHRAEEAAV